MTDPAKNMNEAVDEIMQDGGRLVVIIMPRDMGKGSDAPHGHSALWSRADLVVEWSDGAFHVVKNRDGNKITTTISNYKELFAAQLRVSKWLLDELISEAMSRKLREDNIATLNVMLADLRQREWPSGAAGVARNLPTYTPEIAELVALYDAASDVVGEAGRDPARVKLALVVKRLAKWRATIELSNFG